MGQVILSGVSKGMTVPSAGTPISEFAVGSTVKMNVNGTQKDFLIVHQGLPSSMYDSSCDGTWLLMKDLYEKRQWHSSNSNSYKASTIHSYLNSTFLGLFDSNIQATIKEVKIPYVNGTANSAVASGANGLAAKIFLLSGYEVGLTSRDNNRFPVDGAKLDYFTSGIGSAALALRIGYLNGTSTNWWFRSPYAESTEDAWLVYTGGDCGRSYCSNSHGIRPALILPSTAIVKNDGTIKGAA